MSKLKSVVNLVAIGLLLTGVNAHAICTPNVSNPLGFSGSLILSSSNANDCVENSGNIQNNNDYWVGITSSETGVSINNPGSISTNGLYSYGIYSNGANAAITNPGSISTSRQYSDGITSEGGYSTITNSHSITTSGSNSHGISSLRANSDENATNAIITNSGNITTNGLYSYGIYSSGANATITNSGSITTIANNSFGIRSTGNYAINALITNSGSITTSGDNSSGISSNSGAASVNNLGGITTSGSSSNAIYSTGNSTTNTNSGRLTTTGPSSNAILSEGSSTTNTNSGSINTVGTSNGIYSRGINSSNTNSGTITTTGSSSSGIVSAGSSTTNTNSGNITTSGDFSRGLWSDDASSTNTNLGSITTSGSAAWGIYSSQADSTLTNSGNITTSGNGSHAILASGAYSNITNSGTISAIDGIGIMMDGDNSAINNSGSIRVTSEFGVLISADNSTISNSGSIVARAPNARAIYVMGQNQTATSQTQTGFSISSGINETSNNVKVNLNRGSVIVGDIYVDSNVTGSKLNINLGAGVSYAYSVTGPWTITDLDNRPMVTGSAYAAGIGAQETASEMLYQRTSVVTKALDNRVYAYALNESNVQPYWLDVYYGDASRDAGANYSTRSQFSHDHYGFTVGLTLPVEVTPLELIVNAEHSNLNIDNGSQKIDSDSILAGILAPKLTEIAGTTLSAKAMLGYSNHDGDRKVMSNSQLYDGSYQIKSDYDSYYAVLGASALKPIPINDHLTASVLVGLDLNTQHTESYSEQDFASWNSRTLTQLQSRVQAGFDYTCNEKTHLFGRVGLERRDLIGGDTQDYILHNASVSFNANNSNDTYLTGQLGIRSQLEKRIQLIGIINGLHSSDTVSSIQGNIGLKADF